MVRDDVPTRRSAASCWRSSSTGRTRCWRRTSRSTSRPPTRCGRTGHAARLDRAGVHLPKQLASRGAARPRGRVLSRPRPTRPPSARCARGQPTSPGAVAAARAGTLGADTAARTWGLPDEFRRPAAPEGRGARRPRGPRPRARRSQTPQTRSPRSPAPTSHPHLQQRSPCSSWACRSPTACSASIWMPRHAGCRRGHPAANRVSIWRVTSSTSRSLRVRGPAAGDDLEHPPPGRAGL